MIGSSGSSSEGEGGVEEEEGEEEEEGQREKERIPIERGVGVRTAMVREMRGETEVLGISIVERVKREIL